jgi:demethylmenaquinone methyltransferase/2-methoxy-6-polyprenyl-1,4-benzoquinol methylase
MFTLRADLIAPSPPPRYGPARNLEPGPMIDSKPAAETHFGFRTVPLSEKQALVDDVFHRVAHRYDLMNDLMSAGLHRAWKDVLVTAVNPPRDERPFRLLDVAGGTGDIAFRVIAAGGPGTRATVCDINADMLAVGHERAFGQGLDDVVSFEEGNAEALPFPERSFDAYTIAFGIRNVPRIETALAEAHRILERRRARPRPAVRPLLVQCHSGDRPRRGG